MHLTREEERILDGEHGYPLKKMMEILVALGDIYNAERLIPITSAQISGVSYNTIGDAGLHFLKSLHGVKVKVPTTLNPIAFDKEHISDLQVDNELYRKQMEIVKAYVDMGIKPTMTCTPYYFDNVPKVGEHIAWAESSAVIYANSIIGARTNREGAVTALASAIMGKTPEYGLHIDKNRRATHIVEFNFEFREEHFPLAGLYIGENVDGIPYLRIRGDEDDFKIMGAAMAASGSIAMYHVENITPEFRSALSENVERIVVEKDEIEKYRYVDIDLELVALGCPHLSPGEIRKIAAFVKGKRKRNNVKLWLFVSKSVAEMMGKEIKIIEDFGGEVMRDTCVVVSNAGKIFDRIGTNSGKAAYYLRKEKFGGTDVVIRDMYTLLRSVML